MTFEIPEAFAILSSSYLLLLEPSSRMTCKRKVIGWHRSKTTITWFFQPLLSLLFITHVHPYGEEQFPWVSGKEHHAMGHRFIGLRTMIYCSHFPLYTLVVWSPNQTTPREILKWKKNHQLPIFFYFYPFA